MANRTRITGVVTPVGEAVYPYLNKPDSKFGDPVYKTDLRITGEEALALKAKLEAAAEELLQGMKDKGEKTYKKFKTLQNLPIKEELDDDGDVIEGSYIFRAKTKANFVSKDGGSTPNDLSSRIVDSEKKPLPDGMFIRGGSKIRLCVTLLPYPLQGGGVSAQIEAVQVQELSGGSNGISSFDAIEDGFTVDDDEAQEQPKDNFDSTEEEEDEDFA